MTKPHAISWNDLSRLATIDSLVSRGTFAIEGSPFAARTGDTHRHAGHTYSDKPPSLALQGAAVAAALRPFGVTLERTPELATYLITLFAVGVWFALGCAYAYAFQRLLGFAPGPAGFVAALTGVGTLALPYATVLANHVPAGAAALAGFYHLVRARERPGHALLGAWFLALAYAFDASAIVFIVGAAVLLWGTPAKIWGSFVVACVPVVAAQCAFNVATSGSLAPPGIDPALWPDPSSPFRRELGTVWFSSAGDCIRYALYLLVGGKGLISYTPLTLVCAYGLARMRSTQGPGPRIAIAVVAILVAYFAMMVAFIDDYGALNYGQRRYVDIFFVLCIALGPALASLPRGVASVAARLAIVWSIACAMLGAVAPFGEPLGVSGFVFASEEFVRLVHRAPVPASLDVAALLATVYLVLRFWPGAPVAAAR